ncbi:MAG: BamA/TamA family outer membrane protein [Saprospiraceae bacterium]|nr:BamA/TamA family outer membrane protein [Lewinella sp.]
MITRFSYTLCLCLLGLLTGNSLIGQESYALKVIITDQEVGQSGGAVLLPDKTYADTLTLRKSLQEWLLALHGRAYLEASVDTLTHIGPEYLAFVHIGRTYRWAKLENGNVPPVFLDKIGFRERLYRNRPFAYGEVQQLMTRLLEYAENNGYPFAEVYLDQLEIGTDQINAKLMLNTGPLFTIDELNMRGDLRLSTTYLSRYLGIQPGDLYSRERILRIRERLRELSFLTVRTDPMVAFRGDRAAIGLDLANRPASRFDFIIGVLPNSDQSGRLLITGDFTAEMQNQFGLGESIYAAFEQLRPQTQQLELRFNYPYLFNLPFGLDLNFELYKRDTTYLDVNTNVGIQYLLSGRDYFKAFGSNQVSTLLTVDTLRIRQTGQLPDTLDVRRSSFGLEYFHEALDYRFNPRRGWSILLRASAGLRRLPRNNLIRELDIPDPYSNLPERSFQYRIETKMEAYLPLFRQSSLKMALQTGFLVSDLGILANEQFRIGGARLLRGFDEEFIFATNFAVATLEYRLLLGQNSYLYTFGDLARVDQRTIKSLPDANTVNFPYGLGAGITFETQVGLLGISLALGADRRTQIDLGAPKVHFGYISRF